MHTVILLINAFRDIENIMLLSFDIKFSRHDQIQCRNGEACRISLTCFSLILINLISKTLICFSIYHALFEAFKA